MIAIKELTEKDDASFANFLQEERRLLPQLDVAPLPYPHEEMAVFSHLDSERIADFVQHQGLKIAQVNSQYTIISRNSPNVHSGGGKRLFWICTEG